MSENRHVGGKKGARKPLKSLVDMRHVLNTEAPDKGVEPPSRAFFRKLKKDDPGKFFDKLAIMERQHRQACDASREKSNSVADVGHDKAMQAIDDMLADWDQKQVG